MLVETICYCDYCDSMAETHFVRTTLEGRLIIYDYCKDCSDRLGVPKYAKQITEEQFQNYQMLK